MKTRPRRATPPPLPAPAPLKEPVGRRYLKVADLRRLRHLFFASKRAVTGHYAGRHTSRQRGQSVEFNDHREYVPGDDMVDVDWKVFGRSDRMVIKLFEHQSEMTVSLLVDSSASMGYPGGKAMTKYDQACHMAAAIAFLTIKQQDRVALGFAREGLVDFERANRSFVHLNRLLANMEHQPRRGPGNLALALRQMSGRTTRKGLVILFSDLLEDQDELLKAMSIFTHRGNEVILFHVLHEDELKLPDLSVALFQDSETAERLRVNVEDIRPTYEKRLRAFLDSWRAAASARGIDYQLVSTPKPYTEALESYLFGRAATM